MNTTTRGKIGRLPKAVQAALNQRMENGEKGQMLVAWLNRLEPVRAILKEQFNGQPITEQNLSEWRKRGYQQWLWREEAKEMARDLKEETADLQSPEAISLTDQMASWVTVRYLLAVRKLMEAGQDQEPDIKLLRNFLRDVVMVRRGDHSHARVKLQQQQLDREREKTDVELFALFQEWVEFPKVRALIRDEGLTRQQRQERLAELLTLQPKAEGRMQNAEVSEPDAPSGGGPSEKAKGSSRDAKKEKVVKRPSSPTSSRPEKDGDRHDACPTKAEPDEAPGPGPSGNANTVVDSHASGAGNVAASGTDALRLNQSKSDQIQPNVFSKTSSPSSLPSPPGEGETLAASSHEPASGGTESRSQGGGQSIQPENENPPRRVQEILRYSGIKMIRRCRPIERNEPVERTHDFRGEPI